MKLRPFVGYGVSQMSSLSHWTRLLARTLARFTARVSAVAGQVELVVVRGLTAFALSLSGLLAARYLGPQQYGLYATASAIVGSIVVFNVFGLDQLFLRGDIDRRGLRHGLLRVIVLTGIAILVALLFWPSVKSQVRVCIACLGSAAVAALWLQPWLLAPQRQLRFQRRARRELSVGFALPIGLSTSSIIFHTAVASAAGAAIAVDLLVAFLFIAGISGRSERTPHRVPYHDAGSPRKSLRGGAPYALSSALYSLYFSVDIALLGTMRGPVQAAYYQAAYMFLAAASMLPIVLNNDILRPLLYRLGVASGPGRRIARNFVLITLSAAFAVSAAFLVGNSDLVRLLFGHRYESAASLLTILAFAVIPHYLNSWAGNVLVATSKVRTVIYVQCLLTALNLGGNIALIPIYGAVAAAYMTVLTEWIGTLCYFFVLFNMQKNAGPIVQTSLR